MKGIGKIRVPRGMAPSTASVMKRAARKDVKSLKTQYRKKPRLL